MVRVLIAQADRQERIHRLDYHFTVDLVVEDGRCCGAVVLDERFRAASSCCRLKCGRAYHWRSRADLCTDDQSPECHW